MNNVIFIGGIHGVGKGSICQKISKETNVIHLVASDILKWIEISDIDNKIVEDIHATQDRLIVGLKSILKNNELYLLDGHFCLFNSEGKVERISKEVFEKIPLKLIAVVTADVNKIQERLEKRDKKTYVLDTLKEMQITEMKYAKQVAKASNIPFIEIKNGDFSRLTKIITELN